MRHGIDEQPLKRALPHRVTWTLPAVLHKPPRVQTLRQHLRRHRALAAWLVAFALLLKVVVPTGYMLDTSGGAITITMCSGTGPMKTMTMAMPGVDHKGRKDGQKAEQPCAFSGLDASALAAVDPILLAIALAFLIAAACWCGRPPLFGAPVYLRPPLRGPPPIL